MFTTIERMLVDWFEANEATVETIEGEWCVTDTNSDRAYSMSQLAHAIAEAIEREKQ